MRTPPKWGRIAAIFLCMSVAVTMSPTVTCQEKSEGTDYLSVVQQELARLNMNVSCNTAAAVCRHTTDIRIAGDPLELTIRDSRSTDTVYICFERILVFDDGTSPSQSLAMKLLGLNREMVTAKFEWDTEKQAIRLSTSLNTDSNFDRRALRSQIKGIIAIARKIGPTLTQTKAR
jgi:hypothetical protein